MKIFIVLMIFIVFISSVAVSAGKVSYILPMSCATQSMSPAIQCGDKAVAQTVSKSDLILVGDIICFNPDYSQFGYGGFRYVCHRVIEISSYGYLTKGDNNNRPDYYIQSKDIAFKIVKVVKNG